MNTNTHDQLFKDYFIEKYGGSSIGMYSTAISVTILIISIMFLWFFSIFMTNYTPKQIIGEKITIKEK